MPPLLRRFLAAVAGIVASIVVIMAVESGGHALFPPPASLDLRDAAASARYMASLSPGVLLIVAVGWMAGVLVGTWVATRIAGSRAWPFALIVGAFVLAGAAMNFAAIRHPTWFVATSVALVVAAIALAARIPRERGTPA